MTRQRHCDGKRRSNAEIVRLIQKKIEDEDDDENDWGGNQPPSEELYPWQRHYHGIKILVGRQYLFLSHRSLPSCFCAT